MASRAANRKTASIPPKPSTRASRRPFAGRPKVLTILSLYPLMGSPYTLPRVCVQKPSTHNLKPGGFTHMSTTIFKNRPWLLTASLALALAATGFLGLRASTGHDGANPAATVKMAPAQESVNHGYSAVVKRVVPAVVNISSSKVVKQQAIQMDPFFRQFFGDQFGNQFKNAPQSRKEKGLGSGVI